MTDSTLRFVVLGELGRGGMGRVDLARRIDGEPELLAVKRVHQHLARDEQIVRMFLDEVLVTGALHHAHIVELVGFGSDDQGMFLATEFVRGISLGQVLRACDVRGTRMPDELIALVGEGVASGLAAAHALRGPSGALLGLVHRDVTPENVLVGFDGTVKISDFGVSKAAFKSSHTSTGTLKGKIHYMSPEYARGDSIDGRSDVFSLGVVLYRLACGVYPFDGDHERQVLRKIIEQEAPSLATAAPPIDAELAAIIRRLLAKEPGDRAPGGAAGTASELREWLDRHVGHADATTTLVERLGEYAKELVADLRVRRAPFVDVDALVAGTPSDESAPRELPIHVAHTWTDVTRTGASAVADRAVGTTRTQGTRALPDLLRATDPAPSSPRRRSRARVAALAAILALLATVVIVVGLEVASRARGGGRSLVGAPDDLTNAAPAPTPNADPSAEPNATTPEALTTGSSAAAAPTGTHPQNSGGRVVPKLPARPSPRSEAKSHNDCTPASWDYPRCLRR